MKLIREYSNEILSESVLEESSGTKKWFISGITLQGNLKNRNGRIYPKEILSKAITEHTDKNMQSGRALGELNHPENGMASINLDRVSHKFISVMEDGDNFVTKAEVLDTPCGKIVQNLLAGGVKLGISSRGLGNLKESNGAKVVQDLQLVTLGDIVSDPSGPNAFVSGIMENKEWIYENGTLVEKDLSEEIDLYKSVIESASVSEIQEAVQNIFNDYIGKLLK